MAEQEFLSMAQLDSFEEELASSFNPEADANALPPPIPKGLYVCKATFAENDPDKRWEKKILERTGEAYYQTGIVLEVIDNPANPADLVGRKIYGSRVSTLVMSMTGTTQCQALIQGMDKGDELLTRPKTHQTQIRILNQELNEGGIVGVNTDWEARRYDKALEKETFRLRGMGAFPKNADGTSQPFAVAEDGEEVPARNFVRNYLTVDQVQERIEKASGHTEEDEDGEGQGEVAEPRNEPRTAPKPSASSQTAPSASKPPAAPSRPVRRPVPTR